MRSVRRPRTQALSLRSLGSLLLLAVLGCATSVEEPNRQPENTRPPEKEAEKQEFVRAPAPLPKLRSLEDDQKLLVQHSDGTIEIGGGTYWYGPPSEMTYDGAKQKCTPILLITTADSSVKFNFTGKEEFYRRGSVTGGFFYGVINAKGGISLTASPYRLDGQRDQRYVVFPDDNGGEIRFRYKLDGDTLEFAGDKKLEHPSVGPMDVALKFKRTKWEQ